MQQQQDPPQDSNNPIDQKQLDSNQSRVEIRYIEPHLQTKVLLLVIDKQYSLIVELKDSAYTKEPFSFYDSLGLATYSNSKATVLSYTSIFEALWNQVDLDEKLKESHRLLKLANEQLKLDGILQKEFIGIAAHELKNPIQPIMGLSEVMRSRITNEEQRQLLDIIIRNANRLQHLAEGLLDVSRIESGMPLRLSKSNFNLYHLIKTVIEDTITKNNNQSHHPQIILSSNLNRDFVMHADRDRISQVIINLLNNAIKFNAEGQLITISLAEKDNYNNKEIIISIKDTGTGIDREILPRLFLKFASKSEKGVGLGLYLSKAIVEAHGGKIWAENNKDGKGATFAFNLPITERT